MRSYSVLLNCGAYGLVECQIDSETSFDIVVRSFLPAQRRWTRLLVDSNVPHSVRSTAYTASSYKLRSLTSSILDKYSSSTPQLEYPSLPPRASSLPSSPNMVEPPSSAPLALSKSQSQNRLRVSNPPPPGPTTVPAASFQTNNHNPNINNSTNNARLSQTSAYRSRMEDFNPTKNVLPRAAVPLRHGAAHDPEEDERRHSAMVPPGYAPSDDDSLSEPQDFRAFPPKLPFADNHSFTTLDPDFQLQDPIFPINTKGVPGYPRPASQVVYSEHDPEDDLPSRMNPPSSAGGLSVDRHVPVTSMSGLSALSQWSNNSGGAHQRNAHPPSSAGGDRDPPPKSSTRSILMPPPHSASSYSADHFNMVREEPVPIYAHDSRNIHSSHRHSSTHDIPDIDDDMAPSDLPHSAALSEIEQHDTFEDEPLVSPADSVVEHVPTNPSQWRSTFGNNNSRAGPANISTANVVRIPSNQSGQLVRTHIDPSHSDNLGSPFKMSNEELGNNLNNTNRHNYPQSIPLPPVSQQQPVRPQPYRQLSSSSADARIRSSQNTAPLSFANSVPPAQPQQQPYQQIQQQQQQQQQQPLPPLPPAQQQQQQPPPSSHHPQPLPLRAPEPRRESHGRKFSIDTSISNGKLTKDELLERLFAALKREKQKNEVLLREFRDASQDIDRLSNKLKQVKRRAHDTIASHKIIIGGLRQDLDRAKIELSRADEINIQDSERFMELLTRGHLNDDDDDLDSSKHNTATSSMDNSVAKSRGGNGNRKNNNNNTLSHASNAPDPNDLSWLEDDDTDRLAYSALDRKEERRKRLQKKLDEAEDELSAALRSRAVSDGNRMRGESDTEAELTIRRKSKKGFGFNMKRGSKRSSGGNASSKSDTEADINNPSNNNKSRFQRLSEMGMGSGGFRSVTSFDYQRQPSYQSQLSSSQPAPQQQYHPHQQQQQQLQSSSSSQALYRYGPNNKLPAASQSHDDIRYGSIPPISKAPGSRERKLSSGIGAAIKKGWKAL